MGEKNKQTKKTLIQFKDLKNLSEPMKWVYVQIGTEILIFKINN